ncbi:MAG: hypothetical protein ACYSTJ_04975 [Planctomycetota bacterium]|jgi:hypothetical protein
MLEDSFFRRCWLTLKATNPRLRKRMTEIECGIEGISVHPQSKPSPKPKSEEPQDDSKRIVPV